VGSGKTLIGLHAALAVCLKGGQAALLAPTEILAEQHYLGLRAGLERAGLRTGLLTGSLPRDEQREARRALESGSIQVAVGTHALFAEGVRFARLDLAIIDEQQRFGVAQKRALLEKGRDVHLLLMTATPIPRTLALSLYGDLEQSVLDESPPGRGGVRTKVVSSSKRGRLLRFLAERLQEEERVFWVCPRIGASTDEARDENDDENESEVGAAEHAFAGLRRSFDAFGVELVHGGVPSEERARRIGRFRTGEARLLVGTSVLEVGVDVPEATVMVIEGAERFGLAQLHQLRGRVGRGAKPAWCFLLGEAAGLERMRLLEATCDGFAIAEEDLRRRGMGDLAGLRQAGVNVEGLSDPFVDLELVRHARRLVRADRRLLERYAVSGVDITSALV
jgi:ATP-dependent DNA helicase RecG